MNYSNEFLLVSRVRNCLDTIVDLEHSLASSKLANTIKAELIVLKELLSNLNEVSLKEEDVLRIESATRRFLAELTHIPLTSASSSFTRVLQ